MTEYFSDARGVPHKVIIYDLWSKVCSMVY